MADSYTEVTHQSCVQNFFSSCIGTLIGLVLFLAAFPLLWWNEHRSLEREQALTQGARIVVTANAANVSPDNEGKLVYLTGKAATAEKLQDPTFGLTLANTLRLRRTVEMYQWKESESEHREKEFGGGSRTVTTYTYSKGWEDDLIDSNAFRHPEGHKNPAQKPYESRTVEATVIHVGAFKLSAGLLAKLTHFTPYPITQALAAKLPPEKRTVLKINDGNYYRGANPESPQVGDTRVSFAIVPQGPVSLVAQQVSDTFEPYGTGNEEIHLIEQGTASAALLFQHAKQRNSLLTWGLRGVGALMMIIGIALFFGPLNALANIIPFIGDITEAGTGCAAAGVGVALASATIAVAWVTIRPFIGVPMLVGVVGLIYLVGSHGRRRRAR